MQRWHQMSPLRRAASALNLVTRMQDLRGRQVVCTTKYVPNAQKQRFRIFMTSDYGLMRTPTCQQEEGCKILLFQYSYVPYVHPKTHRPPSCEPYGRMDTLLGGLSLLPNLFISDTMAQKAIYHDLPFPPILSAVRPNWQVPLTVTGCSQKIAVFLLLLWARPNSPGSPSRHGWSTLNTTQEILKANTWMINIWDFVGCDAL